MMKILIRRIDDAYLFRSYNERGAFVDTDLTAESGGQGLGMSPLELLLAGLGSCSGVDVVSILTKGKQRLDTFEATVTAERDGGKPINMITSMHVLFDLTGDLEPEKVRRAVDLSLDKYCTVAKILGATITISTSFSVNGELYDNPLS